jgi:hypothetical protein
MRTDINELLRASPVSCKYGAPMGRHARKESPEPVHVQRVRFIDGDYSADGTYWGGGGLPLFAAFTRDLETLCFTRALNRGEAADHFKSCGLTVMRPNVGRRQSSAAFTTC